MAEENQKSKNVFSANDPLDINELASLNDDISVDFIEQLQNQVALNASQFTGKPIVGEKDDTELFEEMPEETKENESENNTAKATFDDSIDDNFIKKYKAKINKQQTGTISKEETVEKKEKVEQPTEPDVTVEKTPPAKEETITSKETKTKEKNKKADTIPTPSATTEKIDELTSGNIIEKPVKQEEIDYNESLDYLDDNVKYSKYVIYIDPENTDFIESLTVKERKNLINRIIREQDDIALTKKRLNIIQAIIKHSIVAIITISIAVPVVYWTINASLEASINNYRRSQTLFKTMYRDKGKIKTQIKY